MNAGRRRAVTVGVALMSTAALAQWAEPRRVDAGDAELLDLEGLFPTAFGAWRIDSVSRDIVRPTNQDGKLYGIYDRVLERTYIDGETGYRVMLSAAFGAEQSAGMQLHRPDVCYRYAGYTVDAPTPVELELAGTTVPATRLMATRPGRPEPLTFWTILGGVAAREASEIRWHRLRLALKRQRITGLLVRVSSVDPQPQRAFEIQAAFADRLARAVDAAHRARVVGERRA
jgi:EpsI family protein